MLKSVLVAATLALGSLGAAIPEAAPEAVPDTLEHGIVDVPEIETLEGRAVATCPNYKTMVLHNHNAHRANHSAPALVYSDKVAAHAREWASKCIWGHNTSYGEGQNLALGFPMARDGINYWYNAEMQAYSQQYGKATPDTSLFGSFGHFTQVVWKGTSQVGCATKLCPSIAGYTNAYYTVCNYYPPGNYLGQFDKNVLRPKGAATMQSRC